MNKKQIVILVVITVIMPIIVIHADTPSSFGSGFDMQELYKPFSVEDMTPENM
jgi:hypothetical protein